MTQSTQEAPARRRGRPRSIREEPQVHFEDQIIANRELEAALETYLEHIEAAAAANRAKKNIKAILKDYEPGRYRVGEHLLEVKEISGGDFTIPSWVSRTFSLVGGSE